MTTITLVVRTDTIPELNEVTTVTLTNILENGVPDGGDMSRGARLEAGRSEAVITVLANDEPHGVLTWGAPGMITVAELEGSSNVVSLSVLREFGTVGAIVVGYSTDIDASAFSDNLATPLMDFVPITGEVVIGDNQTSADISIIILQVQGG